MKLVNRYLSCKIYFVHLTHGGFALVGLAFVVTHIPLIATLALSPLILLCTLFWIYTARIVFPIANNLWRRAPTGTARKVVASVP